MNRKRLAFTLLTMLVAVSFKSSAEEFVPPTETSHVLPDPESPPEREPMPAPRTASDAPPPPPPPPVPVGGGVGRDIGQPPGRTSPDGDRWPRGEAPRETWPRAFSVLCESEYSGRFTKHGDHAGLRIAGSRMVLYANRSVFNGRGRCLRLSATRATFHFALEDDRNYVFRGTIISNSDGSATLRAEQLKFGKVIDHLLMSR